MKKLCLGLLCLLPWLHARADESECRGQKLMVRVNDVWGMSRPNFTLLRVWDSAPNKAQVPLLKIQLPAEIQKVEDFWTREKLSVAAPAGKVELVIGKNQTIEIRLELPGAVIEDRLLCQYWDERARPWITF